MYNYTILKEGDVLFTFKKGNLFSKLIWKFSKKSESDPKISHSLLYLGDNIIIESTMLKGVDINVLKHYNEKKYLVKAKRIKGLTKSELRGLKRYAIDKVDELDYSYMQLVFLIFKKIFKLKKVKDFSEDEVMCSEFITDCFKFIDKNVCNEMDSSNISPLDLYNDKLFSEVII